MKETISKKMKVAGVLLIAVVLILTSVTAMANTTTINSISNESKVSNLMMKSFVSNSLPMGRVDILSEGFEEGIMPPTDWTQVITNAGYTWTSSTSNLHSGSYGADCVYDPVLVPQDEWLITPSLDFSGYTEIYLSFWWMMSYHWGANPNDNYDLNVRVSTDEGANWDLIFNEDGLGIFENWIWYDAEMGNHIDLGVYIGETDVIIGFQYEGADGAQMGLDDILIYGEGGQPAIPNLDCYGTLSWTDVEPFANVTGTFTVENIGDPLSLLDWEIKSYPEWGNWTFDPENGTGLEEGDTVTIDVVIVAPEDPETEFTGEIVLVNSEDPDDTCTIDVSLATPVSQQSLISLFFEKLAERFPFLALILEVIF